MNYIDIIGYCISFMKVKAVADAFILVIICYVIILICGPVVDEGTNYVGYLKLISYEYYSGPK